MYISAFRINLVSIRVSRGPLLPKQVSWFGLFCRFLQQTAPRKIILQQLSSLTNSINEWLKKQMSSTAARTRQQCHLNLQLFFVRAYHLLPKPTSTTVCPSAHSVFSKETGLCSVFKFPLKPCKFEHGNYCQYKVVNENSS